MTSVPQLETIAITLFPNGVTEIALNRPKRYNALSPQAYKDWLAAFQWAKECDEVKVVVLTGRGKFYSSGQELGMPDLGDDPMVEMNRRLNTTQGIVTEMIHFPKLLIGAVNGPAIGFGCTTLALCDVVYSVPDATFNTPFMRFGFCAEGCSSYLFPKIMGNSKANEMLLMGRTFSAQEMVDCGFISRLLPQENFNKNILDLAAAAAEFSVEAMKVTKKLVRGVDMDVLDGVNEEEMRQLIDRMTSADSLESIMKFIEEGQKKKAAKAGAKL
ncbi:ClpP/crotonase [Backusella circina FSU 941]|nr:ClpP/crotonase [Backusella circina FSU 941]